jgi:hypothetical protein
LDRLHDCGEHAVEFSGQRGGDGGQFALGQTAEEGRDGVQRRGCCVQLGQDGFGLGIEGGAVQAGIGAGDGQGFNRFEKVGRLSALVSREPAAFGPHFVALAFPLGRSGFVSSSAGALGKGVVLAKDFLEA